MIPYLLAIAGGFLIGNSRQDEKFAKGGTIKESDIQVGKKFELANGEIIEIIKLFKENIDQDWVQYTRSSESGIKENSVKALKIFINNFRK